MSDIFKITADAQRLYSSATSDLLKIVADAQRPIMPDLLKIVADSQRPIMPDLLKIVAEASRLASSDIFESVRRMADEIGDVDRNVAEVGMAAIELVISRPEFQTQSTYEQINELIACVKKLDEPASRKLLMDIIVIMIALFLNDFYQSVKQHLLGTERPTEVVRELRTIVKEQSPSIDLQGYRVVAKDKVIARHSHKSKSAAVGTLYCGQVVRLVEKRSKKSLVEWNDQGKPIYGWVLSKNLKQLTK